MPAWVEKGLENRTLAYLRTHLTGKDLSQYNDELKCWVITIPKVFSLIKNPNDVLDILYTVVAVSSKEPRFLVFDHRPCTDMDLGASVVLDVIMLNLMQEWKAKGKYHLSGHYPLNRRVRDIFQCMGMTKHLQIAEPAPEVEAGFLKFNLFRGRGQPKDRLIGPSDQERAATKLTEYLNDCFEAAADYAFSVEGQRQVLQWAGELITNAEEHSEQAEWYAIAFMHPLLSGKPDDPNSNIVGECQLAIFNFGSSVHESLSCLETPEEMRRQITAMVEKHAGRRFFLTPGYSEGDLWTLYALQDGISRFASAPGALDRGKGTVRMIQAFQALGDTLDKDLEPEMTLISGTSCIHFTKRYQMRPAQFEGGTRQIIAFNDANSLDERPDPKHVHSLSGKFPGTLLTFRFFIDKRYLDQQKGQQKKP